MLVKIGGLPAHVLLVHAVVVLLPLAALMLVVGVFWPAARRRFGVLTPLLALVGLILVPVTTHAGEWLEARLPRSHAIEHHADLGDQLLPWAAGLFVMAAAVWLADRRRGLSWGGTPAQPAQVDDVPAGEVTGTGTGAGATATLARPSAGTRTRTQTGTREPLPVWATAVLAVLSVAVAVGMSITLYRIGDSGAHAVWGGVANLPAR